MMVRTMKVMMMVGIVIMGVHSDKMNEMVLNTTDFDLLCDITKATTRLWNSVNPEDFSEESSEKIRDLSNEIDKMFFGSNWGGRGGSIFPLPHDFVGKGPNRSLICLSYDSLEKMPSASDSLAWTILCLCMRSKEADEVFCGLTDAKNKIWSYDGEGAKEKLEEVWGRYDSREGIKRVCEASPSSITNLEEAKENFTASLWKLESALEKKAALSENSNSCDKSHVCVKVTKKNIWQQRLKEIEKHTQTLLEAQREESERKKQEIKHEKLALDPKPEPETTPQPQPEPAPAPISTKVREEAPKQETPKAPEEVPKPEPQSNPTKAPQKQEEAQLPVPENETSACYMKSLKLSLWTSLLI